MYLPSQQCRQYSVVVEVMTHFPPVGISSVITVPVTLPWQESTVYLIHESVYTCEGCNYHQQKF